MWDFILRIEEEAQAMPMTTRRKNSPDMSITNHKKKVATPAKEKTIAKKSKTSQTNPVPPNSPNTSKPLVISDTVEYNIVEHMKMPRDNISLHELTKLKQQQNILLR